MVNQIAVNGREVNGVNNIGDATNGHSPLPHVKNENEEAERASNEVEDISLSKEMGCNFGQEGMNSYLPRNGCESERQRTEFTFESDHEALRGNRDYLSVLRSLAVLQAQKIQAVKDLEVLQEAKIQALKDPLAFVEELQTGKELNLPGKQCLAKPHAVDWSRYGLTAQTATGGTSSAYHVRSSTAHKTGKDPLTGEGVKIERNDHGQWLVRGRIYDGKTKPKTFNQPWTGEEQKRLEELLHEFPSEEVEMERWKKIAARLGNRTPIQVQSRIQKYFIKLHRAGLPIPGRLSKQARLSKKSSQSSSSSSSVGVGVGGGGAGAVAGGGMSSFNRGAVSQFINNKQMYSTSLIGQRHSTFFPHLKPEVTMTEEEEREAAGGVDFWGLDNDLNHASESHRTSIGRSTPEGDAAINPAVSNKPFNPLLGSGGAALDMDDNYELIDEDVSDEEGVSEVVRSSDEYKELMWLKRLRREKEWEQRESAEKSNVSEIAHLGFSCDNCGQDPIIGPRFTCLQCLRRGDASVDLCSNCAPLNPVLASQTHLQSHTFRPARKRRPNVATVDKEYVVKSTQGSLANYLDPNYQYFK